MYYPLTENNTQISTQTTVDAIEDVTSMPELITNTKQVQIHYELEPVMAEPKNTIQTGSVAKEKESDIGKTISDHIADSEQSCLTPSAGIYWGPSGKETYYNLDMSGIVRIMRNQGFSEEEYPYWVRDDGCKMLGDYIMVAADLNKHPRGSIVECSLGTAIVCDTGSFVNTTDVSLDIAVDW